MSEHDANVIRIEQDPKKKLDAVIAVRFSAAEVAEMRDVVGEESVIEFIHESTMKEARERNELQRSDKGFTLFEMLIFLVVMGGLAAIVTFALGPRDATTYAPRGVALRDTLQVAKAAQVIAYGEHSSVGAVLLVDQNQLVQATAAGSIHFAGQKDGNIYYNLHINGANGGYTPTATCLVVPVSGAAPIALFGTCKVPR